MPDVPPDPHSANDRAADSDRDTAAGRAPAVVIGAGPAGLMAAEALREGGVAVDVYDAMPSAGRKFLLAGIGGLNLTHSEDAAAFATRYGERRDAVAGWLARARLDADGVRGWARDLGIQTFVGSSGRVFPTDMKAAPLLRAWLHRLKEDSPGRPAVRFHMRHRWTGWAGESGAPGGDDLVFRHGGARVTVPRPRALVLTLGGASWPRLGSDAAWVPWLVARGAHIAPLAPANCGFDVAPTAPGRAGWSAHLRDRFAGEPLKGIAMTVPGADGPSPRQAGECVITATGLEGSLVYAFSARLRDEIARTGRATAVLDLLPQRTADQVRAEVAHPRGTRSLSSHLRSRLGLHGAKVALLHELLSAEALHDAATLAAAIKALPVPLAAARPVDEAISTAGGVRLEALDDRLMLRALPGVFCAGEMLDWEAPTGGYLLTACLASGRVAGEGARDFLRAGAGPATPAVRDVDA